MVEENNAAIANKSTGRALFNQIVLSKLPAVGCHSNGIHRNTVDVSGLNGFSVLF